VLDRHPARQRHVLGPATILRFAGAPGLGVVYLARLGHDACLVTQADVAGYAAAFTQLTRTAFSPRESAELIRRQASALPGDSWQQAAAR
jgi:hypothetical protein